MQQSDTEAPLFNEPIIKRLKLQPFPLEHIDVEGHFILGLEDEIAKGYDPNQPITVCSSEDPKADMFVADGRHRLICAARIEKRTKKLVQVTVRNEPVEDMIAAKKLQLFFEDEAYRRKSPKNAKEHMEAISDEIRELQLIKYAGKRTEVVDFFTPEDKKKFGEHKVEHMIKVIQSYERRKQKPIRQNILVWPTEESEEEIVEERTRHFTAEVDTKCSGCEKRQRRTFNVTVREPSNKVSLEEII